MKLKIYNRAAQVQSFYYVAPVSVERPTPMSKTLIVPPGDAGFFEVDYDEDSLASTVNHLSIYGARPVVEMIEGSIGVFYEVQQDIAEEPPVDPAGDAPVEGESEPVTDPGASGALVSDGGPVA
jgi:hypothetical protein